MLADVAEIILKIVIYLKVIVRKSPENHAVSLRIY
jgi:hypothetical protein